MERHRIDPISIVGKYTLAVAIGILLLHQIIPHSHDHSGHATNENIDRSPSPQERDGIHFVCDFLSHNAGLDHLKNYQKSKPVKLFFGLPQGGSTCTESMRITLREDGLPAHDAIDLQSECTYLERGPPLII